MRQTWPVPERVRCSAQGVAQQSGAQIDQVACQRAEIAHLKQPVDGAVAMFQSDVNARSGKSRQEWLETEILDLSSGETFLEMSWLGQESPRRP